MGRSSTRTSSHHCQRYRLFFFQIPEKPKKKNPSILLTLWESLASYHNSHSCHNFNCSLLFPLSSERKRENGREKLGSLNSQPVSQPSTVYKTTPERKWPFLFLFLFRFRFVFVLRAVITFFLFFFFFLFFRFFFFCFEIPKKKKKKKRLVGRKKFLPPFKNFVKD